MKYLRITLLSLACMFLLPACTKKVKSEEQLMSSYVIEEEVGEETGRISGVETALDLK